MFSKKTAVYLEFLEKSIRYLVVDSQKKEILEKDELILETAILKEGKLINESLLSTRLDALVKEKKWKRAPAHMLLPDDYVTIREEDIPCQLNYSEVKDYLDLHINQSIRLPFENPKVSFDIIEQTETSQRVFLLAYPHDLIDQFKEVLEKSGLKPVVADISSLSLYRLMMKQDGIPHNKEAHVLLLQWNPSDLGMTVFNNEIPQFNRHTRSPGLSQMWELNDNGDFRWQGTEEALDDTIEEQLNVLERFLEFYTYSVLDGEGSISDIVLSGTFPNQEKLKAELIDRFDLSVHTLELPESVTQGIAALYGLIMKEKAKPKKMNKKTKKAKKEKSLKKQKRIKNEKKDTGLRDTVGTGEEVADDRS